MATASQNPDQRLPSTYGPTSHYIAGESGKKTPGGIFELLVSIVGIGDPGTLRAISLAESGGDATKEHVNSDGSIDRGPYQINSKAWPQVSPECAHDWVCSTVAVKNLIVPNAKRQFGDPYQPWSASKSVWGKHVHDQGITTHDTGEDSIGSRAADGIAGAAGAVGGAISAVPDFLKLITSQNFWFNVGKVLLGVVAIVLGVVFIGRTFWNSSSVNVVTSSAGAVKDTAKGAAQTAEQFKDLVTQ